MSGCFIWHFSTPKNSPTLNIFRFSVCKYGGISFAFPEPGKYFVEGPIFSFLIRQAHLLFTEHTWFSDTVQKGEIKRFFMLRNLAARLMMFVATSFQNTTKTSKFTLKRALPLSKYKKCY